MADQRCAIFITGGASGIGKATALLFASRGWRVGLADIDAAGLATTQALLPGERTTTHRLDVRDRDEWAQALDAFAQASGGRLDVLFNNAGIAVSGPLGHTPPEELDRVVAINLTGVINGARMAYALLKATPGACLLNTASAAGIYGVSGGAAYAATKFGVRGLTESLDAEWAADDIRVRSLMPGFIDTPLLDAFPTGSNQNTRENVRAAGLEFTPVEKVAEAAWTAVHGNRLHHPVGPTARRLWLWSRWAPGLLRKQMRRGLGR